MVGVEAMGALEEDRGVHLAALWRPSTPRLAEAMDVSLRHDRLQGIGRRETGFDGDGPDRAMCGDRSGQVNVAGLDGHDPRAVTVASRSLRSRSVRSTASYSRGLAD